MWRSININKNQIKTENAKSALIKMPHSSGYDGYCFWFPQKLIRIGRHDEALCINYTAEFTFRLFKNGKGKYNSREIIDEILIDYEEFEEAFGITNENISAPKFYNDYETHKPEILEVKEIETLEELKDE